MHRLKERQKTEKAIRMVFFFTSVFLLGFVPPVSTDFFYEKEEPSFYEEIDDNGMNETKETPSAEPENLSSLYIDNDFCTVNFLPVNKGEATLVQDKKNGINILIDTAHPAAREELFSYLLNLQINHLDAVILSNPSPTHAGNLKTLLQRFPVEKVVIPRLIESQFQTQIRGWDEPMIQEKIYPVTTENPMKIGDLLFEFLSPKDPLSLSPVNHSLVFRMIYGEIPFLFTGDIGEEIEIQLIEQYDLRPTYILKVSDFGSNQGSSQEFLEEVDAHMSVVFNDGYPGYSRSPDVLERLAESWMDVYRLPEDGMIQLVTDGKDYEVIRRSMKGKD